MRGWFSPRDGKWIDIGNLRDYDHALSLDGDLTNFSVSVVVDDGGSLNVVGWNESPRDNSQIMSVYDLFEMTSGEDCDINDIAVSLGWARVNCEASITSSPYIHARSKGDLLATIRFIQEQSGLNLRKAADHRFRSAFGGTTIDIDFSTGASRYAEYAYDEVGRLTLGRSIESIIEFSGTNPDPSAP